MTDERIDLIARLGPDSAVEVIANLGAGNSGSPVSIQIRTLACARSINVELFAPHLAELESLEYAAAVVENRQMDVLLWARAQADKSVDIALLLDVLEHFERPRRWICSRNCVASCASGLSSGYRSGLASRNP